MKHYSNRDNVIYIYNNDNIGIDRGQYVCEYNWLGLETQLRSCIQI
jgi:hypothetical protein